MSIFLCTLCVHTMHCAVKYSKSQIQAILCYFPSVLSQSDRANHSLYSNVRYSKSWLNFPLYSRMHSQVYSFLLWIPCNWWLRPREPISPCYDSLTVKQTNTQANETYKYTFYLQSGDLLPLWITCNGWPSPRQPVSPCCDLLAAKQSHTQTIVTHKYMYSFLSESQATGGRVRARQFHHFAIPLTAASTHFEIINWQSHLGHMHNLHKHNLGQKQLVGEGREKASFTTFWFLSLQFRQILKLSIGKLRNI